MRHLRAIRATASQTCGMAANAFQFPNLSGTLESRPREKAGAPLCLPRRCPRALPNQPLTRPPAVLTLTPGTEITANEHRYRIQSVRDLESVVAQDIETGAITRVRLADIARPRAPSESVLSSAGIDLCSIPSSSANSQSAGCRLIPTPIRPRSAPAARPCSRASALRRAPGTPGCGRTDPCAHRAGWPVSGCARGGWGASGCAAQSRTCPTRGADRSTGRPACGISKPAPRDWPRWP